MPTFTALTTLSDATKAEVLGLALEDLDPAPTGVGVFELEDGSQLWEVGGYFVAPPDEIGLALLAAATGAKSFVISELPETDWVAAVRRELHPVRAGRFWLYGSHDADKIPHVGIPLLIEASMAFGTGHHGTTQGCLEALDTLMNDGFVAGNTIDVGCGTAVLAIAAAKVWPHTVMASDIDEVAVDVARVNVTANGVGDQVICLEATGFDHPTIQATGPFDLIFANILKGPLIDLAPDMAKHSDAGGYVILSGLLNEQAAEVIAAYTAQGFALVRHAELGDWSTLTVKH
jgi:ribosomal protein L11 methyltransferase